MKMQPKPVAGQLWKTIIAPHLHIFIDKIGGIKGGTEIVYFTVIDSGTKYETYVKGIVYNYTLVSG